MSGVGVGEMLLSINCVEDEIVSIKGGSGHFWRARTKFFSDSELDFILSFSLGY